DVSSTLPFGDGTRTVSSAAAADEAATPAVAAASSALGERLPNSRIANGESVIKPLTRRAVPVTTWSMPPILSAWSRNAFTVRNARKPLGTAATSDVAANADFVTV